MKTIKLIFCIALCFAFYNCQTNKSNKKNDLQQVNLRGKVKSVRTIPYDAVEKFGKPAKNGINSISGKNNLVSYNDQGNKIEENYYRSDGSLASKFVSKYDDKGNNIELNGYNSDSSLNLIYVYKYDDKENKIEENRYASDGSLIQKYIYKYDDKGNQIEENDYASDGSSFYKSVSKYDDKGNRIEENKSDWKYIYKYNFDEHDNWIEMQEYKNGEIKTITERKIEYY